MQISRMFNTVDVHTGGEPFRIVTSGLPRLPGKTILKRRAWLKDNADYIRKILMFEPRGHADMYGGYLTEPVSEHADFGIIFIHNEGYSDHCGHGVIALATAAVELGWIVPTSPETRVGIDTPCGFIEAFVKWDGQHVNGVRFINVPSFIFKHTVTINTPTFGNVTGDIIYGGAFYFYVSGETYGVEINKSNIDELIKFGSEVKTAANSVFPVVHPYIPEINHIYGTIINSTLHDSDSPQVNQVNCCIFADREVDRSPTGSGTAGRVAQLYLNKRLTKQQELINESIIGSVFKARVLGETRVGDIPAVIPEVSGDAYVYGLCNWLIDERDPHKHGFLVR